MNTPREKVVKCQHDPFLIRCTLVIVEEYRARRLACAACKASVEIFPSGRPATATPQGLRVFTAMSLPVTETCANFIPPSYVQDLVAVALVLIVFALAGLIYTAIHVRRSVLGGRLLDECGGDWPTAATHLENLAEQNDQFARGVLHPSELKKWRK